MMLPEFISVIYFEGRVLAFEKYGDVYEFNPRGPTWSILGYSPWPYKSMPENASDHKRAEFSSAAKSILDLMVKRTGVQTIGQNEIEEIIDEWMGGGDA